MSRVLAVAVTVLGLWLGGCAQAAHAQQINLATQVKGLLAPANGGTGIDTSSATGCVTITAGVWSVSPTACVSASGVTAFNGRTGLVTLAYSDVQATFATVSGCATAGQVWSPASNDCVAPVLLSPASQQGGYINVSGYIQSADYFNGPTYTNTAGSATVTGTTGVNLGLPGCYALILNGISEQTSQSCGDTWTSLTLPSATISGTPYIAVWGNVGWSYNGGVETGTKYAWESSGASGTGMSRGEFGFGAGAAFGSSLQSYFGTNGIGHFAQNSTIVPASGTGTAVLCNVVDGCLAQTPSTATIDTANGQIQADSGVSTIAFGGTSYGDSITQGTGVTSQNLNYVNQIGAEYGIVMDNLGRSGATAQDEAYDIFNTANPGDTENPFYTSMIGTNNAYLNELAGYKAVHLAGHAWLALSSTNKILATNGNVTTTGTVATDTTWTNANGITCSAGPCTLTYTASVGTPNAFILWYKEVASGANFSVTVGGTSVTDTVTGLATINTSWPTPPVYFSATVGAAIYTGTWNTGTGSSQTIVVTMQTGATILGFGFPPTARYRGPFVALAGVPPWQNDNPTYSSDIATLNGYNLADAKTLYGLGLNVHFVDVQNALDPVLDFNAAQNCPASTSPGAHPNNCGHLHLAQIFESVIGGASPFVNPVPANIDGYVSFNRAASEAATAPSTTALNEGFCFRCFSGNNFGAMVGYVGAVAGSPASFTTSLFTDAGKGISFAFANTAIPAAQSDFTHHYLFTASGAWSDEPFVFSSSTWTSPATNPPTSYDVSIGGFPTSASNCNQGGSLTWVTGCLYAYANGGVVYIPFGSSGGSALNTVVTGNITLTTATSDAITITGVTTSSKCSFSPTNATAAGLTSTTLDGYYAVSANTFTLNHAATTASGATYGVMCSLN